MAAIIELYDLNGFYILIHGTCSCKKKSEFNSCMLFDMMTCFEVAAVLRHAVPLFHRFSDQREMVCYSRYHRGRCSGDFSGLYSHSACCCSVGAAWGGGCQPCPSPESGNLILALCNNNKNKKQLVTWHV